MSKFSQHVRSVYRQSRENYLATASSPGKGPSDTGQAGRLIEHLELHPGDLAARHQLARAYFEAGHYELALQQYRTLRQMRPDDPAVELGLARTWTSLGNPGLAIEHSRAALTLQPDSVEALQLLAGLQASAGDYELAAASLERAVKLDPERTELWLDWGRVSQQKGDRKQAERLFLKVLEVDPSNTEARRRLAELLITTQNTSHALEHLIALYRPSEAYHQWGLLFMQEEKWSQAQEAFKRALAIDPTHELARSWMRTAQSYQPPPRVIELPSFAQIADAVITLSPRQRSASSEAPASLDRMDSAPALSSASPVDRHPAALTALPLSRVSIINTIREERPVEVAETNRGIEAQEDAAPKISNMVSIPELTKNASNLEAAAFPTGDLATLPINTAPATHPTGRSARPIEPGAAILDLPKQEYQAGGQAVIVLSWPPSSPQASQFDLPRFQAGLAVLPDHFPASELQFQALAKPSALIVQPSNRPPYSHLIRGAPEREGWLPETESSYHSIFGKALKNRLFSYLRSKIDLPPQTSKRRSNERSESTAQGPLLNLPLTSRVRQHRIASIPSAYWIKPSGLLDIRTSYQPLTEAPEAHGFHTAASSRFILPEEEPQTSLNRPFGETLFVGTADVSMSRVEPLGTGPQLRRTPRSDLPGIRQMVAVATAELASLELGRRPSPDHFLEASAPPGAPLLDSSSRPVVQGLIVGSACGAGLGLFLGGPIGVLIGGCLGAAVGCVLALLVTG